MQTDACLDMLLQYTWATGTMEEKKNRIRHGVHKRLAGLWQPQRVPKAPNHPGTRNKHRGGDLKSACGQCTVTDTEPHLVTSPGQERGVGERGATSQPWEWRENMQQVKRKSAGIENPTGRMPVGGDSSGAHTRSMRTHNVATTASQQQHPHKREPVGAGGDCERQETPVAHREAENKQTNTEYSKHAENIVNQACQTLDEPAALCVWQSPHAGRVSDAQSLLRPQ